MKTTPYFVGYTDYYHFGMAMGGRFGSVESYRYGFGNHEKDDEIKGEGNSINYKFRMHDPRLGRFFAVDPLFRKYPHNSVYAFSENRVIDAIELEDLEVVTLSVSFTTSFGGSAFVERGYIFDFSKPKLQIYSYTTTGNGVETNVSLTLEGVVGYYHDASAQDLAGGGTLTSFSAGEGLVESTSLAMTSNGKGGNFWNRFWSRDFALCRSYLHDKYYHKPK